ncbi:hypothetical protein MMC13_000931 [Lambiella insularis]|nr:hypothetical protein [Lambiella insularis]
MGSLGNAWASEPIAIIGLSCKFPGSASSPEKLWEMLAEDEHQRSTFIEEDVGLFDAAFFNFSAETASALDPQFRLQLESAYEALENAGLPLPNIAGSNTSVYAGVFSHDHHEGIIRDEDQLPRFLPIGTFSAMSSNRISHSFDLRGASMTVDTGCSTTLAALHQAVSSLRMREANMSIVSGSNSLLTPDMFKVFGSLGMLSLDGKSDAFDSRANGYGRGEGAVTIVIKRLNDALACGDPVRAVIREICLNQDGKTETITTPSQAAQEELMHECYRRAGLDPRDTQYFEAHGTGTPTGDPIEARAIATVFGGPSREEALRIGSLKTNIGHTEAVSGLAGLIKVVLALEKGQIPPSINFKMPNPKLHLEEWGLKVETDLERWPVTTAHQPLRASLNSFGFGGRNSHVILEGADLFVSHLNGLSNGRHERDNSDSAVLVLSARDEKACQRMVSDLKNYLHHRKPTEASKAIKNLSYTLGERRTLFPWVAAHLVRFRGNSLDSVIQALDSPSFTPVRTPSRRPRIGMASLQEAEWHLKAIGAEWSLLEELQRSEKTSRVNTTALSIPICVALQISLVQLLESWGITPSAATSHSSGEIAAAYAAGALTLGQAMAAAYYRATLAADPTMRAAGEKGGMLAVGLGAVEAQEYVNNLASSGKAVVACINSLESVTIARDVSAVEELEETCKQASVFSHRLRVDTCYHSHHMQPIAQPYLDLLRKIMPDDDAGNVNVDVLLEVGPHTALAAPIREIPSLPEFEGLDLPYYGCLIRKEHAGNSMRATAVNLLREELLAALVVPDNADGIEVQTKISQINDRIIGVRGWKQFEITSVTLDGRWTLHAKGLATTDLAGDLGIPTNSRSDVRPLPLYTRRVDPEDMFSSLRTWGIYHGPKFQNTTQIEQDGKDSRSVSHMTIADTSVPNDLPPQYVLHPTTLDSVILSSYSALPGVGALEDDAKLPHSIKSLWVSSSISRETGHAFLCHTSLSNASSQNFQADSLVADEQISKTHGPVLEIQGLVCHSMGRSSDSAGGKADESGTNSCPKALAHFKKQHSNSEDEMDRELVIRLRRVCVYFCHDTLRGLTAKDIAQLEPHHVKFHHWMQNQISLAASVQQGHGSEKWTSDGSQEREREIALAAKQSVEGEMVCLLGPQLLYILRGERPPLEVMMDGRLLYRYYADAIRMAPSLVQLAALLRQVVHKNPRARILEIGRGTGGATRHMLKALGTTEDGGPQAASWHFTDISSGFFEAARTEFVEWSDILKFDKLDIEKDPMSQGFELASYDIVVACEVLHATKSMARTMANVHSLMKPGGTLLMMETTQDQVDIQFTFGLLSGWWLSEEPERQSSPSLTIPFCDKIPKGAGFSGIDLAIHDCESEDMYSISVIITMVRLGQQEPGPVYSEDMVIVTSNKASPPDAKDSSAYGGKICTFLGEVVQPILLNVDQFYLEAINTMTNSCKDLIWVTVGGAVESADPDSSLSHGLLRALRNEFLGRRYISLDLEGLLSSDFWSSTTAATITRVLEVGFSRARLQDSSAADFEYAERCGVLLVPRLYKDVARNKMLALRSAIDWQEPETILIDEPFFQQDPFSDYDVDVNSPLAPDAVKIEPRAYGLNFRDVMVAMGQLRKRVMGLECSGIITRVSTVARSQGFQIGDRVTALLLRPFASRAQISWHSVVHIPQGMSFEDAASLPMVFSTVYVGLVETARFQKGQSILIHAAAGGVGQATIMLAKHLCAGEIYATVSSQEKRDLIMREYGIPDDHIFSSRNASFAASVLAATNGRGVDMVLNSLAGPLLQASFEVLATFGHLVKIGKKDLEGNNLLDMGTFSRVASCSSLDMMTLLRHRGNIHRILSEVARLVQEQILAPVYPVTAYSMGDLTKAFRLVQTGKHTGKIVLSTKPDGEVKVCPRMAETTRLSCDASYLLVGGVGGLGRSIAHWLIDHGAKNQVLLSRSAGNVGKSGSFVEELREAGCRVKAISCDVSIAGHLAQAVRDCEKDLPPIRGVIQGAMVLQDSVFEHMTLDDWQTCIGPKVYGTRNLHVQWSQPGSLDFFIILSSFSGVLGIESQANYAAGSAYQNALAHRRQARGLLGVSLDLGAVKGVGYVAETAGVADRMRTTGETLMLAESAVHRALQAANRSITHRSSWG